MKIGALRLDRPKLDDVDAIYRIYSDPQVWRHLPSGRHSDRLLTETMVQGWIRGWELFGLGPWVLREAETEAVLGNAGCDLRFSTFWNLGFRLSASSHGRGYASKVSRYALCSARRVNPDMPVVAYMLEHNRASSRVAEKAGLSLRYRCADYGNSDPSAIRLVYADRKLSNDQLSAALR